MTMTINDQSNSMGIVNHACGSIVTDAVAAVAQTFTLGFKPRSIRFVNLTDRITDEWHEEMDLNNLFTTIIGITAKLDADAGVVDTNYTALWTPAAVVAGAGGPTANPPYDVAGAAANDLNVMRIALTGILKKLDQDTGVADTNYAALWTPATATAAALRASIIGMNLKLDNDAQVIDTNYTALWTPSNALSLHTVANGTMTLEATNGIAVVDNQFTLTATTMVASKQFYWEAIG